MKNNVYVSISMMVDTTMRGYRRVSGRIYTSVESCKLDMHMEVDSDTVKHELAKLMLRTGKMPVCDTLGKYKFYRLTAFLE